MKKHLVLLPIALLGLTSCGPLSQMICLVNQSTCAIHNNREAVEYSTCVIRNNAEITNASTETIAENYRQLQKMEN